MAQALKPAGLRPRSILFIIIAAIVIAVTALAPATPGLTYE